MNFSELTQAIINYAKHDNWIIQIVLIILFTYILYCIQKYIVYALIKKCKSTRTKWDYAFMRAMHKPILLMILVFGFHLIINVIKTKIELSFLSKGASILELGFIIAICWFLARFISRAEEIILEKKLAEGEAFDRTTADGIAKLLRVIVLIIGFLIILQSLGYSISGVLAFGGVSGIAIGFAARDLLANFFGGLTIYLDRPFDVGDWIRSPDKEIEGTVESIGWRLTIVRTFDKRPLYIPNSTFTTISLENPSRMSNRRIKETIGVRYDDVSKIRQIIDDVRDMLKQHEDIDNNQTLIVNFNEFADSSLNFFIYTFTKTTNWVEYHAVKERVLLKIIDIIESHGAECAFPTTTLHIPKSPNLEATK